MRTLVMRCFSFRKVLEQTQPSIYGPMHRVPPNPTIHLWDVDVERQGPKNDGTIGSEQNTTKEAAPIEQFNWDVAFLVVCVVVVAVDPLFLYLPVINEANKCITIDNTLKIIAICVRSLLDLVAFGILVAPPRPRSGYTWLDYVSNILGILPVPQVLLPRISKMSGSKFRNLRKFLNAVVFSQYVPRIFSIYRSLWRTFDQSIVENSIPPTTTTPPVEVINGRRKNIILIFMVMKGSLNLYLYLVASHVLGAFWYFFSIEKETTCWQLACEHDIGCSKTTSLDCDDGFRNYTFLNDYCSIEKPNTTLFDFGIFQEARQSGILASMDFPQKTMFCFWWGLRNLSSLGQNLETSPDFWENCFTVLISIFGLLLFLYFIGNLQVHLLKESTCMSHMYPFVWFLVRGGLRQLMQLETQVLSVILELLEGKAQAALGLIALPKTNYLGLGGQYFSQLPCQFSLNRFSGNFFTREVS